MPIFKEIDPSESFPKIEERILAFWKQEKMFERSVEERPADNAYAFYDGPPFITGLPHYGSLLPSIAKDVVPRYQTMLGKRVRRVWGWDCHGLPAENKVEEQLGIKSKKDIETLGIGKFIDACRTYVSTVSSEWQWYIDRIGRWVDFGNAYKTMDLPYMESVMWVFKQLYEKGLIYKGRRVSLFCPRCSTPISNFEIAMDNSYKDVDDPSVSILFKERGAERYFVAWTTTPWTLIGNFALAVNSKEDYVEVEAEGKRLVVAKKRLEALGLQNATILKTMNGSELVGLRYDQLYTYYPCNENDCTVYAGEFVSMEDGTGIVHIAPGFGEDDTKLGETHHLSSADHIDDEGKMRSVVTPWTGLFFKKTDPLIMEDLKTRGLLFRQEVYRHSYPFCYRCETPLIYKAQDSWFIAVGKLKERMLETNKNIRWVPEHLQTGRFQKGIESAPDWGISRSRYWGSPIPVWECECGNRIVVGSLAELEQLSGQTITDLHKPGIDAVTVACSCGKRAKRVPEVLDCWVESGSMPYAQWHYPFENKKAFEVCFPADFVVEYIAQTRGWFYTMHVISNGLRDQESFKHVVVTGVIKGTDGRKMSKLFKNYPDPKGVLEKYGADALRLYLMGSPIMIGEDININEEEMMDQVKAVLNPLWNCVKYFVTYANKYEWKPSEEVGSGKSEGSTVLDQWLIVRTQQFTNDMAEALDAYHIPKATRLIRPFIDDLSTWFIRRSRARFVEGDAQAFETLYQTLMTFARVAAPIIPFIAEEVYQRLNVKSGMKNVECRQSVHLELFPERRLVTSDEQTILTHMETVRQLASSAHQQRAAAGIKVRQPLAQLTIHKRIDEVYQQLLSEEANVLSIALDDRAGDILLDTTITPQLEEQGMVRDLVRHINAQRKAQTFTLSDRAHVVVGTASQEIQQIVAGHQQELCRATISDHITVDAGITDGATVKLADEEIRLKLIKT